MTIPNKFMVANISVTYNDYDLHTIGGSQNIINTSPPTISMDIMPVTSNEDGVKEAMNMLSAGKFISVNNTDYMDWTEPFKDEFKDFLLKYHPDKILKDPKGFEKIFGEKCD